jgi:hypoxanthine phosphoribosyltransferase
LRLLHVDPNAFLLDTVRLGRLVYQSGFRPKHAISIWRGGTPVGLGIDAFFRSRGLRLEHTTIATDSYRGIGDQTEVTVKNLEHLIQVVCPEDGLLLIDDVYESGRTVAKVVEQLRRRARANAPRDIRVAAVHAKPARMAYTELPLIALREVDADTWIDYPHELADLVQDDDPADSRIRSKSEQVWRILREDGASPYPTEIDQRDDVPYVYRSARELLLDSIRLGVQVSRDTSWRPDCMLALWPGGVLAGLPVHEVYKYTLRKNPSVGHALDHISINTSPTRSSFRSAIVGLNYLEERINSEDRLLIIDTTFRAGRLVNDVVIRLKEVLRRNLNHQQIRVASVYYNPDDRSTWTVRPDIKRPHYYLREVRHEVIYPASVHKLPDPRRDLPQLNPELAAIFYGDE